MGYIFPGWPILAIFCFLHKDNNKIGDFVVALYLFCVFCINGEDEFED